ncbi:DotH/IcmK family type IV secretion protein [Reinekea sp. G2M2-21]|uniref:DotH/IcmK family type IV secretion protein n=1 Tax=Reinekea sp. G2M2-21 TaxID=2788942 RepID=UPI0018A9BE1A|nr:DotH/IcmK family type IV secretion protein [Reinekea sp. G2M2-21]
MKKISFAVLVLIVLCTCSLSFGNDGASQDSGPNVEAIASGATVSPQEQAIINQRVLESFLQAYKDDIEINALTDALSDKALKEQAERQTPTEQRNREEVIDPNKSRGPFSVWVYPNHLTIIAFLDSYGEPWPLTAQPINSNTNAYKLNWSASAPHIVQVSVLQPYITTTIGVMLEGHTLPLTFSLRNGNGIQDVAVTYRVTGVAPSNLGAIEAVEPPLQSPILQQFVRRDYPEKARMLSVTGQTGSMAWEYENVFVFATKGGLIYPSDPFAIESAPDSDLVYYAFKDTPDAVAIQFGSRPLTLGIR